ncbi:hypothetical protein MVEN_01734500 [Mycena venus]|uniref:Uncharacterized protein n=1 Tax=Mycena venus TaxID=2733690 RepID=A0A8H6XMB2_9AGAR|nr:hypothetical protein MVEN_01734500 [Mycena venus]
MASVVARIKQQTNEIRVHELHLMLNLIQLVLNVDSMKADAKLKHLSRVTNRELAKRYAPGTHENTFGDWINHGKKLMLLCAGGTLYLLPIIAALNLRTKITRQSSEEDILSLASALRRAKHGLWLPMVRRVMMPIFHMRSTTGGYIQTLRLHRNVPMPVSNQLPRMESFGFSEIQVSDRIFDGVQTHFPKLHPRSSEWDSTTVPAWKPLEDPQHIKPPPVYMMETPLKFEKTRSPVNKKNRKPFTNTQRDIAIDAPVAESLDDLQEMVDDLHVGGNALHMKDANGKLLALLFTVPEEYQQQLTNAAQHIHACMPGEFVWDNSTRENFTFRSCHYSWAQMLLMHTLMTLGRTTVVG